MWKRSFSKGASSIVIDGSIKGPLKERGINFVLDTGAAFCLLPVELIEDIGYDPMNSDRFIHLKTVSGVVKAPLVAVEKISLFGIEVENIDVACFTLPVSGRTLGLLGLDFFKDLQLTIDFRSFEIIIE